MKKALSWLAAASMLALFVLAGCGGGGGGSSDPGHARPAETGL